MYKSGSGLNRYVLPGFRDDDQDPVSLNIEIPEVLTVTYNTDEILFTIHLREGVEVEVVGVCAAIEMPGV